MTNELIGTALIAFAAGMIIGVYLGDWWRRRIMRREEGANAFLDRIDAHAADEHETYFMRDQADLPAFLRKQAD